MLAIDYNTVILNQSHDIRRSKQKLGFVHSSFGKWVSSLLPLDAILGGINRVTTIQLMQCKGIHAEIRENYQGLQGRDLTKVIGSINHLLNLSITLHAIVIEVLNDDKENEFQKLNISKEVLEETIETLYAINRLFKKSNLKKPLETSQLAIDSSKKSVDTLGKVIYS